MQNELVEIYLNYKKESLLSYAETFYKVYQIDDEKLWETEADFRKIISGILDVYVKKYYLRSKKEVDDLNTDNINLKDFKLTLALAMISDYYGSEYNEIKDNYKKSIYNLTLIIYVITNIDKEITFYKDKSVVVRNIVAKINELFGDVFQNIDISKNPFLIDILANKIKDNERKEMRFFEMIKGSDYYNDYLRYDMNIYYVNFNYELAAIQKYKEIDSKHVYQKYKFKELYTPVCYELACMTLLKCFANNSDIPKLLLPVTSNYLKIKRNVDHIKKIFSNPYLKEYIYFSIFYSDYKKNYDKFNVLRDLNFKLVLFMDESEMILDYFNIKFDFKLYVTDEFIENNPKFNSFVSSGNVKYNIVNIKDNYILEDELINISMKEEN